MKFKLNQGFITQKMGNKTTIFAGEESILHSLNETGAYIFNGLKLGWERKKIVEGLIKKYGVAKSEAEKDLDQFTKDLVDKKIISKA